jgi:hypothetical protein
MIDSVPSNQVKRMRGKAHPSVAVLAPRVRVMLATLIFLTAWILGAVALTEVLNPAPTC